MVEGGGKEKHIGDTFHNEVIMERALGGGRGGRWRLVELQSKSASESIIHKTQKFSPGFRKHARWAFNSFCGIKT